MCVVFQYVQVGANLTQYVYIVSKSTTYTNVITQLKHTMYFILNLQIHQACDFTQMWYFEDSWVVLIYDISEIMYIGKIPNGKISMLLFQIMIHFQTCVIFQYIQVGANLTQYVYIVSISTTYTNAITQLKHTRQFSLKLEIHQACEFKQM